MNGDGFIFGGSGTEHLAINHVCMFLVEQFLAEGADVVGEHFFAGGGVCAVVLFEEEDETFHGFTFGGAAHEGGVGFKSFFGGSGVYIKRGVEAIGGGIGGLAEVHISSL